MAGNGFEIELRVSDGSALIALRGDIDAYTGPRLTEQLEAAVAETAGDVRVDLSNVSFVDSSGIAVFVAAAKKLRERGSDLIVESPAATVNKVLEMTGVTKLLKVERSGR